MSQDQICLGQTKMRFVVHCVSVTHRAVIKTKRGHPILNSVEFGANSKSHARRQTLWHAWVAIRELYMYEDEITKAETTCPSNYLYIQDHFVTT